MDKEQSTELVEYYYLLIDHKWIIIISIVIMIALTAWYNSRLPYIYRATATLIVDKEATKSPITGQETNYETYLSESLTFNTHFELISSRKVLERVRFLTNSKLTIAAKSWVLSKIFGYQRPLLITSI